MLRMSVEFGVTTALVMPSSRAEQYLHVTVQNHSPILVFIASIAIPTRSGVNLWPSRDAVTGEHQTRRPLRPGESYSMFLDGDELLKERSAADLLCAVVTDDVGRQYRSSEEALREAIKEFTGAS